MADERTDVRTIHVRECALGISDARWPFADDHAEAIDAYWARASVERPKLFNGRIYLLSAWQLDDERFSGTFIRTEFKSFLYWRETGYREAGVKDAFGSSLIRSADDAVLLGRQTEGNMNSGVAYPLSGMIDADDAGPAGIDIDNNVARELGEESGLLPDDLIRVPGYLIAVAGPLLSIGIEWRSRLEAEALRTRMLEHIRGQRAPELADIVIVRGPQDIEANRVPAYARAMLGRILCA